MIKKLTSASLLASLLFLANPVLAAPEPVNADHPGMVYLGEKVDKASGKKVEGYAFIHYANQPQAKSGNAKGGGVTSCYAFMASGARWKAPENYVVDLSNSRGLDPALLSGILAGSVETWDVETPADVFGVEAAGLVDGADTVSPDGKNEVMFADVASSGAIAVTIVWGIFRGPAWQRSLAEWDMVFDDVDFDWSTDGSAGKMDFQNIATHELGHAAGMDHPSDGCTEETMYRYASFGETKKRDLNTGDINGIKALYQS